MLEGLIANKLCLHGAIISGAKFYPPSTGYQLILKQYAGNYLWGAKHSYTRVSLAA